MLYLNNFENNGNRFYIILTIKILSIFLLFLEIEKVGEIGPNKIIIY